MSRRTVAGLLALGLLIVLGTVAARTPVDYVTFRPGPTMNILGEYDGKTIVTVTGRETYRDDGALRMVTVYAGGPDEDISLLNMVYGWIDPDIAVLPKDAVYGPDETDDSAHEESAVEMSSSQDNATAAALDALDVDYRSEVSVTEVAKDGASVGKLEKGDVLLAVDGTATPDPTGLVTAIRAIEPGTQTVLTVRRDGAEKQVTVTTKADPEDEKASRIGIGIKLAYTFPFKVRIQLPGTVGGPSAGMIFALAIYDVLTPGSLTGGKQIAGSGEINPDGTVGAIGGIGQKLPAAQRDGAKLFLVAAENCAEALSSHYDPDKMRLVKVEKLADAIKDVETWRDNPDAPLPRCTR
jgi:PDZ domain-containing protein